MGEIRPPIPVKLFVAMLSSGPALFETCENLLAEKYGPIDYASGTSSWQLTDYYAAEMGPDLLRKFVFFERLMDPAELAGVKVFTNGLEAQMSAGTENGLLRRINLDPGYITEAKVVLASTKDYAHRIYIGNNIYAEVTLQFRGKSFISLEHTYPDYGAEESIKMFIRSRDMLRRTLHSGS